MSSRRAGVHFRLIPLPFVILGQEVKVGTALRNTGI
jgi:hypothetical protein